VVAPEAVNVAGFNAHTMVDEALAFIGNGETVTVVTVVVMPQPFSPITV
jgi:hypothetical protein